MTKPKCPECGSPEVFLSQFSDDVYVCKKCGAIFTEDD